MALYSVTYQQLKEAAGAAVGLQDLAQVSASTQAVIDAIPNVSQLIVARERVWQHLRKSLTIALVAESERVLLPADFLRFERDDRITYPIDSGYSYIERRSLGQIQAQRAAFTTTGPPAYFAFGETVSDRSSNDFGRRYLEIWPKTEAARDLRVTYQRLPAAMVNADDKPDLPVALADVLVEVVESLARKRINQSVETDWEAYYKRRIDEVARQLLSDAPGEVARLKDLIPEHERYPRGFQRELDENGGFPLS